MFCVWGRSVVSGSYTNAQCGTVGRTITICWLYFLNKFHNPFLTVTKLVFFTPL
jgi:hypothetical protein